MNFQEQSCSDTGLLLQHPWVYSIWYHQHVYVQYAYLCPNFILHQWGCIFSPLTFPHSPTGFVDFPKASLTPRKMDAKSLSTSAFSMPVVIETPFPFSSRPTFSLLLLIHLENNILFSFMSLARLSFRFVFIKPIPAQLDHISIFFLSLLHLSLLSPLMCLIFMPEFSKKLLVHPCMLLS